jgi:hypothetical protein
LLVDSEYFRFLLFIFFLQRLLLSRRLLLSQELIPPLIDEDSLVDVAASTEGIMPRDVDENSPRRCRDGLAGPRRDCARSVALVDRSSTPVGFPTPIFYLVFRARFMHMLDPCLFRFASS